MAYGCDDFGYGSGGSDDIIKINPTEIFLIEEGWIDPMENKNADGYKPYGFMLTEKEAKEFCESKGYWTQKDCWSIMDFIYKDGKMPKYKYTTLKLVKCQ